MSKKSEFFSFKVTWFSRKKSTLAPVTSRQATIRKNQTVIIVSIGLIVATLIVSLTVGNRIRSVIASHKEIIEGSLHDKKSHYPFSCPEPTRAENYQAASKKLGEHYQKIGLRTLDEIIECNRRNYQELENQFEQFDQSDPDWINPRLGNHKNAIVAVKDALPTRHVAREISNRFQSFLIGHGFFLNNQSGNIPEAKDSNSTDGEDGLVELNFELTVSVTDKNQINKLMRLLDNSIKPFLIKSFTVTISEDSGIKLYHVTLQLLIYYQTEQALNFNKVCVRGAALNEGDDGC